MKKLLTLTALLALSTSSFAAFNGGAAAGAKANTVAAVKSLADDTPVTLVGTISKQVAHDEYLFRDASGQIVVVIDNVDWNGVNVAPNEKIRIYGEVDKEMNRATKIDVKRVEKAQ